MSIPVTCGGCGKAFKVKDEWAGKAGKCPACGARITVPMPASAPPPQPRPAAPPMPPRPHAPPPPLQPMPPRVRPPAAAAAPPQPPPPLAPPRAAAGVPALPGAAAESGEVYPWETPPEVLARVAAYEQQGAVQSFLCHANECLNAVPKDAAVGPTVKADLRIYPDVVGVDGRAERLGCLGLLLGIPALALVGPFALLMAIPRLLISIVLYPIGLIVGWIVRARLAHIAAKIRRDPNSPYAVKKMFRLSLFMPRYWQRGDAVQLVRADVRRFLCGSRSLLLIVQHAPIPRRPGCLEALLPMLIARRRVYFVWLDQGEAAADAAAQRVATALGLSVERAVYSGNNLRLP